MAEELSTKNKEVMDMAFTDNYLYESVTEYDIDGLKHYDMKFGAAKQTVLSGYSGEKNLRSSCV